MLPGGQRDGECHLLALFNQERRSQQSVCRTLLGVTGSRKRFWKSEDDQDKALAYKTLHYVLVQLAHVIAPFTPFLAEELFMEEK